MDKKLFVESINAIHQQVLLDIEISEHLGKAFPGAFQANLLPSNSILQNQLIKILQTEMKDGDKWIDYFCWELNFGQENWRLKVTDGGKEVPLTTPEDLYKLLLNGINRRKTQMATKFPR